MSTANPSRVESDAETERLQARPDDPTNPTELTLFPAESQNPTTEWITIDCDDALPSDDWV